MDPNKRAGRILLVTLVLYVGLVATHLGEFWPFSIYPMFSKTGRPWSRAIVRVVKADEPASFDWSTVPIDEMPGEGFALKKHDIDPIDLANFVSKTKSWDADRVDGMHRMFKRELDADGDLDLLVMRVNGRLETDEAGKEIVVLEAVPYVLLDHDRGYANPELPIDAREEAAR